MRVAIKLLPSTEQHEADIGHGSQQGHWPGHSQATARRVQRHQAPARVQGRGEGGGGHIHRGRLPVCTEIRHLQLSVTPRYVTYISQ